MHIVVVGGGITGAFTAYHLARMGIEATLVERGEIAGEASGSNPGGLNPHHGPGIPGPMHDLARESFRMQVESWPAIRELSGIEFDPRRPPRVHLAADEAEAEALRRAAPPRPTHRHPGSRPAGWSATRSRPSSRASGRALSAAS